MVIVSPSRPIAAPTSRLRLLLQSFRAAAMDSIAECGRALDCFVKAQQADAVMDRTLVQTVRVASIRGQEAQVRGCGCDVHFDRLSRLVADAQQADACEDRFLGRGFALVGQGVNRMRVVAGTADRVLEGKGR